MGKGNNMPNANLRENLIDQHVGTRTRALRLQRGISQSDLANELGVSFQQVQKYETGTNRISASKLYTISQVLGVKPGHFFDGLDDNPTDNDMEDLDVDAARIAALISKVSSKEARDCLRELIKVITIQETPKAAHQAAASAN